MIEMVRPRLRRTLRRSFKTSCQAVRLHGFSLVGERILDLSHRGALVACERPLAPGEELVLSFRAPHGPTIDAVAEVRRVVEGWRYGTPDFCAGLRFTEIDEEARSELMVRLAGFPPPVPVRRPRVDYAETVRRIGFGAFAA